MICAACWLASAGAKMTEATTVLHGSALCNEHLEKVGQALEQIIEDSPDVTPH
jgi:hypothetical protein